MLRVHFTDRDLTNVRVSTAPDPMWETVLSLHRLRAREVDAPAFSSWRRRVRQELPSRSVRPQLRLLSTLVPTRGYFPDFLTPPRAVATLRDGLSALRDTPPHRFRRDLAHGARERTPPAWARSLATGDRDTVDLLATAVKDVRQAVVIPAWHDTEAGVDAERNRCAEVLLSRGLDGLLRSFDWVTSWDGHLLTADYPYDLDLRLDGRGLRLLPSYFCWRQPVALADPTLPPVLVYPIPRRRSRSPRITSARREQTLIDLLGRTRARVLTATANGPLTTSDLARRTNLAVSSASEHLAVLHAAQLVRRRREANTVLHALAPAGEALLEPTEEEPD